MMGWALLGRVVAHPFIPNPLSDERADRVSCFQAVAGQEDDDVTVGDWRAAIDGGDKGGCADGGGRFDVDALFEEVTEGRADQVVVDRFVAPEVIGGMVSRSAFQAATMGAQADGWAAIRVGRWPTASKPRRPPT